MIAISRKVIILDLNKYSSGTLMGIAAVILAQAAGYYFFKRSEFKSAETKNEQVEVS